jgi:peptidyl-dipeptidase A
MSTSSLFLSLLLTFLATCAVGMSAVASGPGDDANARARQFIKAHEEKVRPLEIEANRCWWQANLTGNEDDFRKKQEAETQLDLYLSDHTRFADLKAIKEGRPSDPLLARQIAILHLQYLPKQVDPELLKRILEKSNAVERAFNVFRPEVSGKELTDNDLRRILRESKDSNQRRAAWEAQKAIGPLLEPNFKQLVQLRNQSAHQLGFKDFHQLQLYLNEQDQQRVLKLFDELDALTAAPFHAAKTEIDAVLASNCGIRVDRLQPWHYHDPFFQEPPDVWGNDFAEVFQALNIPKVAGDFYAGIGLPVADVLAHSDLYEKKGKNPHGFCTDIDRAGDVRILVNIVPSKQWLATTVHELGHAAYSKYIAPDVPYVLHTEAHALTTEGVAMMFERLAGNGNWLTAMGVAVPDLKQFNAVAAKRRRMHLLVFSRWCQVMFRFEKELYGNPDQDLSRLWWDLVEKYQEIKRPADRHQPDYAAKIHIVIGSSYYHNYMMGDLFASQVHHTIARELFPEAAPASVVYVGNKAVGRFMQQRVFAPGRTLDWEGLTRHATGEDLNAKAFAADIRSE